MRLEELVRPALPADVLATSVSDDGVCAIVRLRGEADLFTLPKVIDVLTQVIADTDGPVIVDLAETEFADTATLRAVGRAWAFLSDRGRHLAVRSPSPVILRMLGLLGLAHVVEPAAGAR